MACGAKCKGTCDVCHEAKPTYEGRALVHDSPVCVGSRDCRCFQRLRDMCSECVERYAIGQVMRL